MTVQRSVTAVNAQANSFESTVGTSPRLRIRTGGPPSNCAAPRTGTVLVEMVLPSDWLTSAVNGTVQRNGTWSGTASSTGTAGHYEIVDSTGTVCHEQGRVSVQITKSTTSITAVNSNSISLDNTTGLSIGMLVSHSSGSIPAGTRIVFVSGSSVVLSHSVTNDIFSGESILFNHPMVLSSVSINTGQIVTVSSYSFTVPGI